jgi:hypothetical protein
MRRTTSSKRHSDVTIRPSAGHDRIVALSATTHRRHAQVVDEFAATTLDPAARAKTGPRSLAAVAAAEHITNYEWLHTRVLSRIGLPDADNGDAWSQTIDAANTPLFSMALGDGGDWDW